MFPIFHIYGKAEKGGTTIFAPVLDTKIDQKNNLVYCATFQLAWDELKKLAGGNIEMENAPDLVSVFVMFAKNRSPNTIPSYLDK